MEYKIGNEARCAVIGYGSWATAIVGLLTANETRVGWYVRGEPRAGAYRVHPLPEILRLRIAGRRTQRLKNNYVN